MFPFRIIIKYFWLGLRLEINLIVWWYLTKCSYGWYFTFVQGLVYVALIHFLNGFTPKQMVNPWKDYVKLSTVLMGSHGLTKGSLAFLNYPAQIMFKSAKVNT